MRDRLRLHRDESGFSLVTGLAIVFTSMLLIQVLMSHAVHVGEQTGNDRRRTQAFHIADAGIDRALSMLATDPNFSGSAEDVTAGGTTIGSFSTTVGPIAGVPSDRTIRSTGTSTGGQGQARTIETSVTLVPLGSFEFALFSASTMSLNQHFAVQGSTFSAESITLSSHSDVIGDVISPANVVTGNNSTITGIVWAGGDVTIANGTTVNGNVLATGNVTVFGKVAGDVRAATITVSSGTIGGQQVPGVSIPKPLVRTLPTYTYNPLDYSPTPVEYVSADAFNAYWTASRTAMSGVFHVTDFTGGRIIGPNQRTTLTGDLTIITDRPIEIPRDFESSTGDTRRLVVISTYEGSSPDAVKWTNNITMPPNVEVFIHTTGTANFANQKDFHGIVYAQRLIQDQHFTITYEPDVLSVLSGFTWDLSSATAYDLKPGVWHECNAPGGAC